jgi:hypothetical protein
MRAADAPRAKAATERLDLNRCAGPTLSAMTTLTTALQPGTPPRPILNASVHPEV